jgi:hypothetical protein
MLKRKRKRRSSRSVLGDPTPTPPSESMCRDLWHAVNGIRTETCSSCHSRTTLVEPVTASTVMRPLPENAPTGERELGTGRGLRSSTLFPRARQRKTVQPKTCQATQTAVPTGTSEGSDGLKQEAAEQRDAPDKARRARLPCFAGDLSVRPQFEDPLRNRPGSRPAARSRGTLESFELL